MSNPKTTPPLDGPPVMSFHLAVLAAAGVSEDSPSMRNAQITIARLTTYASGRVYASHLARFFSFMREQDRELGIQGLLRHVNLETTVRYLRRRDNQSAKTIAFHRLSLAAAVRDEDGADDNISPIEDVGSQQAGVRDGVPRPSDGDRGAEVASIG